jgi:hypothetical protein
VQYRTNCDGQEDLSFAASRRTHIDNGHRFV